MKLHKNIVAILACLLLLGCGQKGKLVHPGDAGTNAATNYSNLLQDVGR